MCSHVAHCIIKIDRKYAQLNYIFVLYFFPCILPSFWSLSDFNACVVPSKSSKIELILCIYLLRLLDLARMLFDGGRFLCVWAKKNTVYSYFKWSHGKSIIHNYLQLTLWPCAAVCQCKQNISTKRTMEWGYFVVLTGTQCKSLWIRSTHAGHFQFSIFNFTNITSRSEHVREQSELTMCEHNGWALVCRNRKAAILNNNRLRLHNLRVCLNCAVSSMRSVWL